jgi:hypothetical protein
VYVPKCEMFITYSCNKLLIIHGSGRSAKAIPVIGHGGPQGCDRSRLPHFLDNRLTDGSKVVSLMRRLPFNPQEDSWYSFLLEAESTSGL